MEERNFVRIFLLVPALVVVYFVYRIFEPFIMPICLATILASLCYPGYSWIASRFKGRDNLASLTACLVITAVLILPFLSLLIVLIGLAAEVYVRVDQIERAEVNRYIDYFQQQPLVGRVISLVQDYVPIEELDQGDLRDAGVTVISQVSSFIMSRGRAFFSGAAQLVTSFFIMLGTMFFLFRDGASLLEQIKSWTPLSNTYEELIISKFREVVQATILGSLITALAQGTAGGLVFWILGLPNSVLWGSLMAIFSLVPLVGTAIIWLPWALYLLASGSVWKALILTLAAVLFVGMIDNLLRPVLIEGRAKMHTLLVFLSIMGGIGYFGIVGMILGPIIVALGLTFVELYRLEFKQELAKPAK